MKRTAKAHWKGNLKEGKGEISTPSSILNQTNYSFKTRFEQGVVGTNPEELIAAAHAGCFTMAISAALTQAGISANDIETEAILSRPKLTEQEAVQICARLTHLDQALHQSRATRKV